MQGWRTKRNETAGGTSGFPYPTCIATPAVLFSGDRGMKKSLFEPKLCKCGCGEEVRPGNVYIQYHANQGEANGMYGRHHTEDAKKRIGSGNLSINNGMWRGNLVSKSALHLWVKSRLSKPERCQACNRKTKKLDMANISGRYLRKLSDWKWLCRRCHMLSDGRMNNLLQGTQDRKLKACVVCGTMTNRTLYCITCYKEHRKEWWRKYNKKRSAYMQKYNKERTR
jgi:hypothetical protein